MKTRISRSVLATACALLLTPAFAGDRMGVLGALDRVTGNWPAAELKAGLAGGQQNAAAQPKEVVLGSNLAFAYEARTAGHATLLHVNSHGEMQLLRQGAAKARSGKTEEFQVAQPLGTETLYVIFSDAPVDALFGGAPADVSLGDDRAQAEAFATRISELARQQKIALARVQYQVVATAGATEYTTRGIVRRIVEADEDDGGGGVDSRATHTIPARIEFAFNSADLTPRGRLDLDTFGEALLSSQMAERSLSLEGHTDSVGANEYNCDLSLRRAQAAREYLLKSFGVAAARVQLAAFGESRPIASNSSESSRHQNRRVEFVFTRPGETSRSVATPCSGK